MSENSLVARPSNLPRLLEYEERNFDLCQYLESISDVTVVRSPDYCHDDGTTSIERYQNALQNIPGRYVHTEALDHIIAEYFPTAFAVQELANDLLRSKLRAKPTGQKRTTESLTKELVQHLQSDDWEISKDAATLLHLVESQLGPAATFEILVALTKCKCSDIVRFFLSGRRAKFAVDGIDDARWVQLIDTIPFEWIFEHVDLKTADDLAIQRICEKAIFVLESSNPCQLLYLISEEFTTEIGDELKTTLHKRLMPTLERLAQSEGDNMRLACRALFALGDYRSADLAKRSVAAELLDFNDRFLAEEIPADQTILLCKFLEQLKAFPLMLTKVAVLHNMQIKDTVGHFLSRDEEIKKDARRPCLTDQLTEKLCGSFGAVAAEHNAPWDNLTREFGRQYSFSLAAKVPNDANAVLTALGPGPTSFAIAYRFERQFRAVFGDSEWSDEFLDTTDLDADDCFERLATAEHSIWTDKQDLFARLLDKRCWLYREIERTVNLAFRSVRCRNGERLDAVAEIIENITRVEASKVVFYDAVETGSLSWASRNYLFGAVRRRVQDQFARHVKDFYRGKREVGTELLANVPDGSFERQRLRRQRELLETGIALLPKEYRDVVACHLQGMTVQQIGEKLGYSKSTASNRSRQAKQLLREYFGVTPRETQI